MSHRTLERLYVRLLFDPALVEAVHADASAALAGLDLEANEVRQILAVDRRSWNYDVLRRFRTLRTLSDEYKASTTLVLGLTRSLASLEAFFSSTEFHDAVQRRGSLAIAFGVFLQRLIDEKHADALLLRDVIRLERMVAGCRRAARPRPGATDDIAALEDGSWLAVAPGHAAGRFDANVVETMNAAERYLFEVGLMPAVALCDDAPRLADLPSAASASINLLALPAASGVSLLPVDDEYFALLETVREAPRTLREIRSVLVSSGIAASDVATMVESLLEEAVLERRPGA